MKLSLRQALLGVAFLIVYGVVVFAATRAYYLDQRPSAAAAGTAPASPAQGGQPPAAPAAPAMPLSDDPTVLSDQADELFTAKRYGQAIAAYRKLLTLLPGDVETYNDLGLALHYAGRTDEALQVLEEGAATDPRFQRILLTLGFVRLQVGRVEEARAALQACVDIDPASPIAVEARRFLERIP